MPQIGEENTPLIRNGSLTEQPSESNAPEKPVRDAEFKKRWLSISIAYVVNFILMVQNSVYWASLWPYLSQIDPTANESFFGFIIMAFNLASCIASPLFGLWCNKKRQAKAPIMAGIAINIVGNIFVGFTEAFPTNRKWILLVGRFITGFGVGNVGTLFAYVAMASLLHERNFAVSVRASVNALAVLIGPGLQVAFTPIGYPGYSRWPFFFNMYTAPAWVSAGLGVLQLLLMGTLFKEYWVSVKEEDKDGKKIEIKFDKLAVFVCTWTRMTAQFCMTYDITIGSPFTMTMFHWTREQAVSYNGTIQLVSGLVMVIGNIIVGTFVMKYVQDRKLILIGLFGFLMFFVVTFSWPGLPPLIDATMNASLHDAIVPSLNHSDPSQCTYSWCPYTTKVSLAQYLVGYVLVPIAISISYVPNGALVTKIIGPGKQGTMNGIYAAGVQLAMTISPIVCSTLFEFYGPRVTWVSGAVVILFSIVLVCCTYSRLIPYEDKLKIDYGSMDSGEAKEEEKSAEK